jgi:hypothetical protein
VHVRPTNARVCAAEQAIDGVAAARVHRTSMILHRIAAVCLGRAAGTFWRAANVRWPRPAEPGAPPTRGMESWCARRYPTSSSEKPSRYPYGAAPFLGLSTKSVYALRSMPSS